jgi:drug/metabolite transporter (DMT)-like permease
VAWRVGRFSPASLAFVTLGVVWGSNFVFMKWASEWITPGRITFLRVLFGFVPILTYAIARGVLARWHIRQIHHFVVMLLLATSIYYFAFAAGTARLPSGIAGALSGAIPLFSFLAAAAFLRSERITVVRVVGVLIGFAGVLFIARPWETAGAVDSTGVAYMLLGSASVGVSFVYARRFLSRLPIEPAALTTYQIGIALLMLAVATDYDGITRVGAEPRAVVGLVIGLGIVGTGVAYILYYVIVERLGAITASSATYIPPVVALVIGWGPCRRGGTHVQDVAGISLILVGVVLLRLGAAEDRRGG